jgi:glycosyltransferase involved in cell wall biosynthesis
MNLLFIHQNMPGQFRHLIGALAVRPEHRLVCVGKRRDFAPPGVGRVVYELGDTAAGPHPVPPAGGHRYAAAFDAAVRHGQQVARACEILARNGFRPDLIVAHPGWGEPLYVKEVFPATPLLHYCEWYYRTHGADTNFDPAAPQDLDANSAVLSRNAHLLTALEGCDWGYSPTAWQKQQHPAAYRGKISVRFDGIDTDTVAPDPAARFVLPDGRTLAPGAEVVTYVARSLEPYRGFPSLMRALPEVLRRRPAAQVVVVGADDVSYGRPPPGGGTWREALAAEAAFDPGRVHFLGRIPRAQYIRLLQISAVHVYLTVPFVLSWSMLEAMAAGCLIVGSATPPVQEVIEDGRNGWLVDFFSPAAIADRVVEALAQGPNLAPLRQAARWTALGRYALARCLPRQVALLETLAAGRQPNADD